MKDSIVNRCLHLFLIVALLLVGGCNRTQPDPPVAITVRGGTLSDFVLQVSNMSSQKSLEVYTRQEGCRQMICGQQIGDVIFHPGRTSSTQNYRV